MHVLVLPKWYPGRHDPQLGDFIRKQMLATAPVLGGIGGRMSVVAVVAWDGLEAPEQQELDTANGPWELRCYYRPSRVAWKPLRKLMNLQRYLRASRHGVDRCIAERGAPDLVHVHILVRPALIARRLLRRLGIPYILSEQSSEYLDGTWAHKSAAFKRLNRHLFREAAAVTAVSTHLGDALRRLGLCDRYEVVPNTIPGMDTPLPQRGPAGRFLVVADLVDRIKNVSGVLRALRQARDRGADLSLDVIGDGTDAQALKRQAETLGLNGAVRWLGRMSNAEVLRHMGGTGAVIINSNVETFSVVTGEALALGKPVIATRCGGPQAFITEANGLLIGTKDDAALADAMWQLTTSPDRYDPATVRASVSDRFSPQAVGGRFVAVYRNALGHA